MIIGIAGKIGAGKDTVGEMIQCIHEGMTYEEFITNRSPVKNRFIKKVAYIPKQIVCLMVGCTMEDLEDRELKDTRLPQRFWTLPFFSMVKHYEIQDPSHLTLRCIVKKVAGMGRKEISPSLWIDSLLKDYNSVEDWIITDIRFLNEIEAVRKKGGVIIKVESNREKVTVFDKVRRFLLKEHIPESERELINYEDWDYIVINNGSKKELFNKIKNLSPLKFVSEE